MHIYKQNEVDVRIKEERRQQEKEIEAAWASHQNNVLRMMEASEQGNKEQVEYLNKIQANALSVQREELKMKQEYAKKDKFGAVGNGFFDKFGTSCR